MDELRLKNELNRIRDANLLLNTENSTLKERLTTEKLKNELLDQEIMTLTKKNAELNLRIADLQRTMDLKVDNEYKYLEISHRNEILETLTEQVRHEKEAKTKHSMELNLEIARNNNLRLENEKLKIEGHNLLDVIQDLRKEIRYLKMNNQDTLSFLKYSY